LDDVGVGPGPSCHCIVANPDELNVIGVRDVQGVVTSLRSEEVESVVENKVTAINRVVAIYVDVVTVLIVGLGNVSSIVGEPRGKLLVRLRREGWVTESCLTA
jgi:hypothetical protein